MNLSPVRSLLPGRSPTRRLRLAGCALSFCALALVGCVTQPEPDQRGEQVGYRAGTVDDDYKSSGERGSVTFTEIAWAGSAKTVGGKPVHDPKDIFIELRNSQPRPIHLTGWLIDIEISPAYDGRFILAGSKRSRLSYVIPKRENRQPVMPSEYVTIAAKRGGAFDADYYLEGLELPTGAFQLTLKDSDERLMDSAGDSRKPPFAGGWDGNVVRSMERIQLVFANRGERDNAWHAYSLSDLVESDFGGTVPADVLSNAKLHVDLRTKVRADYKQFTLATPGRPNSPDYSGNVSSGSLE